MLNGKLDVDVDDLPEGRFIGFYATRDEMSEEVSWCLPYKQLFMGEQLFRDRYAMA